MSTYVISDIHGSYDAYMKMLEKIQFSEKDTLYVLGDILDRGPHPIKTILDLMKRPNVSCVAGNHEYMAVSCLQFLLKEITEQNLEKLNPDILAMLLTWQQNGADSTINEFYKLDAPTRKELIAFISDFNLYEEIHIHDRTYILVHAGFENFKPSKPLWKYELDELIWERPDYNVPYYPDKYVITGHTPTMTIPENPRPGYIYKNNRHIAIDCGAVFGGRLACLCLETEEEFYVTCR